MLLRIIIVVVLIALFTVSSSMLFDAEQNQRTERAMKQLSDSSVQQQEIKEHYQRSLRHTFLWAIVILLCFGILYQDIRRIAKFLFIAFLLVSLGTGCRRTFEPVKLEVIKSNEEAFLLPLTGDGRTQGSSDNETYLKENLVYTQQVKIPQQWVKKGYETIFWNGEWKDSALLIKVDKSPVTREWTADPTSGTSKKNEAIWCMTSDQVEFSTGWTITARISNRDDAVKFLHNYPNGSLTTVLDTEVRSKLQAEFGLEVTDLPMDELRKNATPHIKKTTKSVTEFFKIRGITITNIGITGGFVYKDRTILGTMVRVFNAEQEKSIASAETNAQLERNKKVILKATGEADALLKTKKAEADGIKLVADARLYELTKAAAQLGPYVQLKQLELHKDLLGKWDGSFPRYFMGSGSSPSMLLQLPPLVDANKK